MRAHGHPTGGGARWLGQMGPHEQLQQNLRRWSEIRWEGMWQSAASQQWQILLGREEEVHPLQHHGKFHCLSVVVQLYETISVVPRISFLLLISFLFPFSLRFLAIFHFKLCTEDTFFYIYFSFSFFVSKWGKVYLVAMRRKENFRQWLRDTETPLSEIIICIIRALYNCEENLLKYEIQDFGNNGIWTEKAFEYLP